jgi:hypothetical protein
MPRHRYVRELGESLDLLLPGVDANKTQHDGSPDAVTVCKIKRASRAAPPWAADSWVSEDCSSFETRLQLYSRVSKRICRPVLPADDRTARRLFSTIIGRRGRYGSSLFRDQSGLAAACCRERHAGGAAVALSTGGVGLYGVDAVLARSMMTDQSRSASGGKT